MRKLAEWIAHREEFLGIGSHAELADASGVPKESIQEIIASGSLGGIGRSGRSWLARALRVSVRDLEALDAGTLDWIPDSRVIDGTS